MAPKTRAEIQKAYRERKKLNEGVTKKVKKQGQRFKKPTESDIKRKEMRSS